MTNTTSFRMSAGMYAFLALLLGFSSISTDLYLPAMPTMEKQFGAGHGALEWTVSGYLLGFSIGQLFWGPFSDRRGRRLPLAIGIGIFIVGSLGCSMAGSVEALLLARVVQALGASASVVIGRVVVADLFHGKAAAQVLSTLTAIMVIAPMIGPLLGAKLLGWFGWPAIFYFLVAIGIFALTMLFRLLPETLPLSARTPADQGLGLQRYLLVVRHHRLRLYGLVVMAYTAGVFSYVAGSSFAFVSYYGLTPDQYGVVFGAAALGIIGLNLANRRLVNLYSADHIMVFGLIVGVVAGAMIILGVMIGIPVWVFAILTILYCCSNGLVTANALSGGLNSVTEERGRASAFLGFSQYGGGMIGSLILGFLANGTLYPLAFMLFATCALSLVFALRIKPVH
ncbi:MAG: multidrug effflux MFS transporter [Thermomicrobiales bacterium]|nr:multidrug effflux MFS transporter [Thermomicrobiales bacterium]